MTSQPSAATSQEPAYYRESVDQVVARMGSDASAGLTSSEAASRLATFGENVIASEPAPTVWSLALKQLKDSMNIMLIAVSIVSAAIGESGTALLVAFLVVLNVVLGTRQEVKARASVNALAKMQIPQARVTRDGRQVLVDATHVVPGDIVSLEAGDIVPADGRIVRSATLETQEASLTGESAPVSKDAQTLEADEVPLGDRTNMVFQNTSVTRGTCSMVVTETGMGTQMGKIASMLSAVAPKKSPLQAELDDLTKVLATVAWVAVAIIVILGIVRDQSFESVLLLGVAMAISAIPTGLPTFVQAMLAYGAKQLADAKAVVKNLNDVETLGATSAINSDKTGTLTMNQMTVRALHTRGRWYSVAGEGYDKVGAIRSVAGDTTPDFTDLAYVMTLCSDATVSDGGAVVGDPTEAALVVLAAKMGVDAEESRVQYPRLAEVPFDSAYKFMATFHTVPAPGGGTRQVELVKGGPDVMLARCTRMLGDQGDVPIDKDALMAANQRLSQKGMRVLAFAYRDVTGKVEAVRDDPMPLVEDLVFIGLVGMIDPLRPTARGAVQTALRAGIEVRMITGDHAITAGAIGAELGLGTGAVDGSQLAAMSDDELTAKLPDLHVFGRVTPQDKLRLVRLMQAQGEIVAMTGDAVNDAAALKQADIGVAMGSGSEVTKQAGKMILTDDNFGTLVKAVELGRNTYDKITNYVRYQMSQLLSLVLLFLTASIFNINAGVALTPLMVLFLNFFIAVFPVITIMHEPPGPGTMTRPPRDPKDKLANPASVRQWILYGGVLFLATLTPLVIGRDQVNGEEASVPMTMAFVVMALGTALSGPVLRRDLESGLTEPIAGALKTLLIPVIITVVSVEWTFMQAILKTESLGGTQWLACIALALTVPVVIEITKWSRRRRLGEPTPQDPQAAVSPERALVGSHA